MARYNFKHGMRQTPIYETWKSMHARCGNPNNPAYKNYGGRGIKVCKRWFDFMSFFNDMGHRPKGKSLDRKNNNRGYGKDNCRWATTMEQSKNSRRTRTLSVKGHRYHISEYCRLMGVSHNTIRSRLYRGWSLRKAVTYPIGINTKPAGCWK